MTERKIWIEEAVFYDVFVEGQNHGRLRERLNNILKWQLSFSCEMVPDKGSIGVIG